MSSKDFLMTDKDEAKKAALRAYKNDWYKKRYAARKAAGLCAICGGKYGVVGARDAFNGMCLKCTETIRRREILRQETERAQSADVPAPKKGWRRKASVRVCRHCKGRDLVASGPIYSEVGKPGEKRERFLCRGCNEWSYGKPLPPAPENLCPYCKGRCWKMCLLPSGSRQYMCPHCGRTNTNLFPGRRLEKTGPFRRIVYFNFGPMGGKALTEYCSQNHIPASQALRTILRAAATPLVAVMATAQHEWPLGGRRQKSHVRLRNTEPSRESLHNVPFHLPDIRSEVTRVRMKSPGGKRHRPVAMEFDVEARLDDLAWEGLIRTMRWRGVTHQEAMRQLLMEAWRRMK
jgi:hypothetical protein